MKQKEQLYGFARQRRLQQAGASKLCPALQGDSKGPYRLSSETGLLMKVSELFSLHRSFRVLKPGVRRSRDGFWVSSGLPVLDLLSGMKIACREGLLARVSITKENHPV